MDGISWDFKPNSYNYRSYGSVFRNQAMALETLVLLKDSAQQELVTSIGKRLSSNDWMSTQETSYALLALGKMIITNGGKNLDIQFTKDGQGETVKTPQAFALRELPTTDGQNTCLLYTSPSPRDRG